MVNEKVKSECVGCRVCEHVCPQKAITMIEDEKGFRYPRIDSSLCNNCGLCDKKCGFVNSYKHYGENPQVIAVKHIDDAIRRTSSSGGMFVAISDEILHRNGVIYGVGYGPDLYVCHKRAETVKDRDEFKGSKYVQSDLGDSFLQIKKDLSENRFVLFTGTPCQVSALNSFLGKEYQNLFTADLICHGTPSNKMWQVYLREIEKKNSNKVKAVYFRDKTLGWHQLKTKILFERKTTKKVRGEQSYLQLFLPNYMLMPACHNCKFRSYKRPSDITLGDFWGIEKTMPDFDDNQGISLVMINSPKGKALIEKISEILLIKESSKEHCAQDQIIEPVPMHPDSQQFWTDYLYHGMEYVLNKYTEYSEIRTFFRKAVRKVKRIFLRELSSFAN